jgi:hypothetical protein
MNKYLSSVSLFALTLVVSQATAQVAINEIQPDSENLVELKNMGGSVVDVSSYQLCSFPTYNQIANLTVVSGSTIMAPGDILVLSGHNMGLVDGELALYMNTMWTNSGMIVDYVEWGFSGHQRSIVAQGAGIWGAGDFVEDPMAGTTLAWDGEGDAPSNWIVNAVPTFGEENFAPGECDGGTVSTADGLTQVMTCTMDGTADVVEFDFDSPSESDYLFIITSDTNDILGLPGDSNDFDDAPAGTCRVWGVSYTGTFLAQIGDNIDEISLSDDCFDLSSNFITVIRDQVSESSVETTSGDSVVVLCVQDNVADVVMFQNNANSLLAYSYIITDDQNNVLGLPPSNMNDFDVAPAGTCRVWGLNHTEAITVSVGDNIDEVAVSTGCFMLSANFIEIQRHDVTGGDVSLAGGGSTATIVIDGEADVLEFETDSDSDESYAYIVTDVDDNVLTVLPANSNDFNEAEPGECHLYGASYTGELVWAEGDAVSDVTSSGCFELSDNWVVIIRQLPENIGDAGQIQAIAIYPNPTTDVIRIDIDQKNIQTVQVLDISGNVILSSRFNQLNLETLSAGSYVVRVITSDVVYSQTVVKR